MRPNEAKVHKFFEYIRKREQLRLTGRTTDLILKKYKFCNVRRINDACTMHLMSHIALNMHLNISDKIFNMILYRRFNTRWFWDEVPIQRMKDYDPHTLIDILEKIKPVKSLFNDAYTTCQVAYDPYYRPRDKHVQIALSMKKITAQDIAQTTVNGSSQSCFDRLNGIAHGVGKFLAYQIMQDITYIPGVMLAGINTWVHVGPGAMGGLMELYGHTHRPAEQCLWLHKIHRQYTDIELDAPDIQANLCEFRKMVQIQKYIETGKRCKLRIYTRGNV